MSETPVADRLERAGTLALLGGAGAIQFSIAVGQILISVAGVCWLAMVIIRRERIEAPRFFWPLLAYAAWTLVSALLSSDKGISLRDCKQLALFLIEIGRRP